MPVNRTLPLEWYNTPNIHLCTLKDFEELCEKLDIEILERRAVSHNNKTGPGLKLFPNLFGEIALYRFRKKRS
jgi:methionine biosynthesis protein MetW